MKKVMLLCLLAILSYGVQAQYSAVRINTLGLATGTLNVGIDVAVSDKWSVDIAGYWNPISTNDLRMKVLGCVAGVRRWRFEPHVGLFWGMHSSVAQYRVGNRRNRYNGWTLGIGSSAGYSWMLARRWNFSVEGGLGIYYMDDIRWNPSPPPDEDVRVRYYRRIVLAPAKLEASCSYLF